MVLGAALVTAFKVRLVQIMLQRRFATRRLAEKSLAIAASGPAVRMMWALRWRFLPTSSLGFV
jgi:hypothetical protein